jgi:hypothetical protein
MLHFAKFPLGQLPARSAIFEFKAEVWKMEATLGQGYSTLRVGILEDTQRIAGAPTVGLYGDAFYAAIMAGNGDGGNCGNAETCPPGGQGSCEPVPPSESAGYRCVTGNGGLNGGDGWISVFDQAIKRQLIAPDDADFRLARTLIADFLPLYSQGKRCMSLYYILSMFLRFDRTAMEEYVGALPQLRGGIYELLHGQDDSIIVSEELYAALLRIIALHEEIDNPVVQRILPVVQSGLALITGKQRSEVIDLLNEVEH